MDASDIPRLKSHVQDLEQQLHMAKTLLRQAESRAAMTKTATTRTTTATDGTNNTSSTQFTNHNPSISLPISSSLHNLLLLSDSALPLGSFAYSSGLESYLAHHKPLPPNTTTLTLFHKFLTLSIQSLTFSAVPYMLASFRDPLDLSDLDNDLDASTPCTVQRRASIAQGKALMSIWEKAMARPPRHVSPHHSHGHGHGHNYDEDDHESLEATTALHTFAHDLKQSVTSSISSSHTTSTPTPGPRPSHPGRTSHGHLAPVWGVVTHALGLTLEESAYLFLLNHVKAVVSAAVRASVMGPYMAQTVLADPATRRLIVACLERVWFVTPEDAVQVVPVLDLWVGRHELLYSRIFNS